MKIEELIRLCVDRNPATDAKSLQLLQEHLGLRFPRDYVSYLLEQNGGFFRNVSIRTPWHPESGDRLESIYHVDLDRVKKSWDPSRVECDEYDLDDSVGCMESVLLLQDEKPIRHLPIASTALGHLVVLNFKKGDFERVGMKGAYIDDIQPYCDTFREFIENLEASE